MESYRIDYHDGQLCMVNSATLSHEPIQVENWYRIFHCNKREYDHVIGLPCIYQFGGKVSCQVGKGFSSYWVDFTVDPKAKPIHGVSTPIPRPKTRNGTEVEWRSGRWYKYLNSRGWVEA